MKSERDGINPAAKPSGTGCSECSSRGGWWFHLRRCAECGHIGCCDSSPSQHASKHYAATGHPIITSFEPGERWFYDYRTGEAFARPEASHASLASAGSTGARTGRNRSLRTGNCCFTNKAALVSSSIPTSCGALDDPLAAEQQPKASAADRPKLERDDVRRKGVSLAKRYGPRHARAGSGK